MSVVIVSTKRGKKKRKKFLNFHSSCFYNVFAVAKNYPDQQCTVTTVTTKMTSNSLFEDGDIPPLSARESFIDASNTTIPWPSFNMQTAQDDLRVRAEQRESTRDAVGAERAKKAKRLQKRYDAKIERVELYAKHREQLRRKVRDLNVKHSQQRSDLRNHISRVRQQGSLTSGVPLSGQEEDNLITASSSNGEDALSMLRQSVSSAMGLRLSSNSSSSSSSLSKTSTKSIKSRARTTGQAGRRQRPSNNNPRPNKTSNMIRGRRSHSAISGSNSKKQHVPDGSSVYEFESVAEESSGSRSRIQSTTSSKEGLHFFQKGGGGSSIAISQYPSSFAMSTKTSAIDAETGEVIELNLTSSMPAVPQYFNGLFSKSEMTTTTGNVSGLGTTTGDPQQQQRRPERKSWTSVPGTRSTQSNPNMMFQMNPESNFLDSGSSLLQTQSMIPSMVPSNNSNLSQRSTNAIYNNTSVLRAMTAQPVSNRSGFLSGKDARKMMANRAKHVNLGHLAPRDMVFPQPTTFWEKEWAQHSGQHATSSSVHISDPLRNAGMKHVSDMRQRQMQDMSRLLNLEKMKEIDRQAKGLAEKDIKRKKRLHRLSTEDRQRSRAKILRIAREHELALASRMASLGILR